MRASVNGTSTGPSRPDDAAPADDRVLEDAGFDVVQVEDATESVAGVGERWHAARAERREELVRLEGEEDYEGLQRFLAVVHQLAEERRLSRYTYLARRP